MDELTIDEKKYISSKRAAKITGYAKDYVGQLCREGYVEARRVGRNWYVLESAMRDRRFGTKAEPLPLAPTKPVANASKPLSKAWEAPTYEAIEAKELPSINRLRSQGVPAAATGELAQPPPDFHEAWQTWFDTFRTGEGRQEHGEHPPGEVHVPIHILPVGDTKPPLSHLQPRAAIIETRIEDAMSHKTGRSGQVSATGGALRVVISPLLIIASLVCVAVAAIGTGYFDKNIISYKQADIISGISIYNKY